MSEVIRVRRHVDLAAGELDALQSLFDGEYHNDFGPWNPDMPSGYSPADTHVLAFHGEGLAAHVGFQRRLIRVGVFNGAGSEWVQMTYWWLAREVS